MQFLGYVERTHDFLVCTHVILNAYCEMIGVKHHILYMSWVYVSRKDFHADIYQKYFFALKAPIQYKMHFAALVVSE